MTTESRCESCGARLSADGTCPGCLLDLGLSVPEDTRTEDPLPGPGAGRERIGPYRLLEVLGEGGMGIVYLAEQDRPIRRRVALKLIRPGMDSAEVIARFESERQALALMSHPNVAKVLDAGLTEEGRPYFVMEHVPGVPITEFSDQRRLPIPERLELFLQACDALLHAHQKGIIHRDVKPSNALVSLESDRATVKVIDFGVAKATTQRLTERTMYTRQGIVIGTPEYMSPEQAGTTALDVDTRTDIYSLGVVLYELLVGARPFEMRDLREAAELEIFRIIREVDPPKPSTRIRSLGERATEIARRRRTDPPSLARLVSGELEWIALKAIEKDPGRRYPSAAELAADIRRYLGHEPVLARPQTGWYRMRKFVRRNRLGVGAAAAVFLALLGGAVVSTILYLKSQQAERTSRTEAQKAEAANEFLRRMLSSADPRTARGRDLTVREVLDAASGTVATELAGQPEVEDSVRVTIATTYQMLGAGDAAIPHWTWVHDRRRRSFGEGDERTILALRELGLVNHVAGHHDEAVRIYRDVLEISRHSLGEEHERTIDAMAMYGNALKNAGNLADAEPLLLRARDIADRVFEPGDESYIWHATHWNLADLYRKQGWYREAVPEYERAIDLRPIKRWGEDGTWTIRVLNEAAELNLLAGRLLRAEEIIDEALTRARRGLGERHPVTAWAVGNLGKLLLARGDLAGAETQLRAALAIMDHSDRDHPDRPDVLGDLSAALLAQGKLADARAVTREYIEWFRRQADRPDAGSGALNKLAWTLLTCEPADLRDPAAALPLAEVAVRLSEGKNPGALDTLALALQMSGDTQRAIAVQREAHALLPVRWTARGHAVEERLVRLLEGSGETDAAEEIIRRTLARRRESLPAGHPDIAQALIGLGQALARHGKGSEAVPLLREALKIRRAAVPPDDLETAQAAILLGAALAEERAFAEAETLLLEVHAALSDPRAVPAGALRAVRRHLAALYAAWGKRAEADRFAVPAS